MTRSKLQDIIAHHKLSIDMNGKTNEVIEREIARHFARHISTADSWEPFIIEMGTPMLASSIKEYKHQSYAMATWLAHKKEDGVRCLLGYMKGTSSPTIFTRGKSVATLRPIKYATTQFAMSTAYNYLLDGELIYEGDPKEVQDKFGLKDTLNCRTAAVAILRRSELNPGIFAEFPLTFVAFDIVLEFTPLWKRLDILKDIVEELNPPHVRMVESAEWHESNQQFLDRILATGGEGIILKDRMSSYKYERSTDWLKVKGTAGGGNDLSATHLDGHVSGFVKSKTFRNAVAAFIISNEDDVEVARISGMTLGDKTTAFATPDVFLGKRLVYEAADITTAKSKASHARFVRWKEDEE